MSLTFFIGVTGRQQSACDREDQQGLGVPPPSGPSVSDGDVCPPTDVSLTALDRYLSRRVFDRPVSTSRKNRPAAISQSKIWFQSLWLRHDYLHIAIIGELLNTPRKGINRMPRQWCHFCFLPLSYLQPIWFPEKLGSKHMPNAEEYHEACPRMPEMGRRSSRIQTTTKTFLDLAQSVDFRSFDCERRRGSDNVELDPAQDARFE